jgi:hypothetical protein
VHSIALRTESEQIRLTNCLVCCRLGMAEKKASGVWKYFERVDAGSVRCVLCKAQLASSGSTSSMRNHVRAKHPGASLDTDDKQKKILFVRVNYRLCDPAKAETCRRTYLHKVVKL